MIWGIHYFITKLKTKIDVIPRSCFRKYRVFSAPHAAGTAWQSSNTPLKHRFKDRLTSTTLAHGWTLSFGQHFLSAGKTVKIQLKNKMETIATGRNPQPSLYCHLTRGICLPWYWTPLRDPQCQPENKVQPKYNRIRGIFTLPWRVLNYSYVSLYCVII